MGGGREEFDDKIDTRERRGEGREVRIAGGRVPTSHGP